MRIQAAIILAAFIGSSTACDINMRRQKKIQPYEESELFADERGSRVPPHGTIARGHLIEDVHLMTGRIDGLDNPRGWKRLDPAGQKPAGPLATYDRDDYYDTFPFEITTDVMQRGRERYNIYCSPCHGMTGRGDGIIVQRGFPPPPSFHEQRLRDDPPGRYFSVITNGYGNMYSYASRVTPEDRWAIIAYIRALQLSTNATIEDVPENERERLMSQAP